MNLGFTAEAGSCTFKHSLYCNVLSDVKASSCQFDE